LPTESTVPLKDSLLPLYLTLIFDFSVVPPPGVGDVEGLGLALVLGFVVGEAEFVQVTFGTHEGGGGGNGLFDAAALGLELAFGDVEPDG
jgi:hypothetical protein